MPCGRFNIMPHVVAQLCIFPTTKTYDTGCRGLVQYVGKRQSEATLPRFVTSRDLIYNHRLWLEGFVPNLVQTTPYECVLLFQVRVVLKC